MAVFVFTDGRVEINSVDLSNHVRKVTLTPSADAQESTAMGATYRARIGGLKDWKVEVEFNQDYAASNVDVTLFALLGSTTTIKLRPTTGSISATNPEYSGSVLLSEYVPIDGAVGDLAMAKASFDGAGTLARATS